MRRKYGKNDILKFIYGEMSPEDHDGFLDALCTDDELFEAYEEIKNGQDNLVPVELEPSDASVDRIMHFANAANSRRKPPQQALAFGKSTFLNYHHVVSVVMVFFTCFTIGIAMYLYNKDKAPENNWSTSRDVLQFENQSLDQRLHFARQRLESIIDDERPAPMQLHHNTYRLVNTDLSRPAAQGVVLLNIK